MRVVFMGTPQFAVSCLEALVASPYEVAAVYTQPDRPSGRGRRLMPSPVKAVAVRHHIPVLQPRSLRDVDAVAHLRSLSPQLLVVAAFGQILPQDMLDVPPQGSLNVHPSLLPRHRGPAPIPAAILAGDEITGVSIMLMDVGMDTGPVLSQQELKIEPQDTTGTLTDRLSGLAAKVLMETIPLWLAGASAPRPQDHAQATYSHIIRKEDGRINWGRPAVEIWRQVRAVQPWPGAYTIWKGALLKIIAATPMTKPAAATPGKVVGLEKPFFLGVQTGDGVLVLHRLQREGRQALAVEEFLKGQRDFVGSLLT